MKRIAVIIALTTAALAAGPLSQGERDRAMSSLHATRKMFLDEVANLSDAANGRSSLRPNAGRLPSAPNTSH